MDYADVAAHFLTPSDTAIPTPDVPDTAARRLRDALEPIATIGWWSQAAGDAAASVGLDFMGGYVWGRAASLGADVSSAVVVSAFGVFEPGMLTAGLDAARSIAPQEVVLLSRQSGATEGLIAATSHVDPSLIASLGGRLGAPVRGLDGAARALFSALRALPEPTDPYGRLWRCTELVREHRGDGHLAACVAAGLDAVEMNIVTELWLGYPLGEYTATRGFSGDRIDAGAHRLRTRGLLDDRNDMTDAGRIVRDDIEKATDTSQQELVATLGDDIETIIADATTIGAEILASRAAPADPRKRAAG